MSHTHLGRRVQCAHLCGLTGTVVRVNTPVGTWRTGDPTFEVIWDDLSCTRRVALALLEAPGWTVLDAQAATPAECAQMWHEYQLRRVEEMSRHCAARRAAPAPLPAAHLETATREPTANVPPGREITAVCRDLLAKRFPDVEFTAFCDRRSVTVSWTDGPVSASVTQALATMAHKVDRLFLRKAHSRHAMRAAIAYVVAKAFPSGGDEAALVVSRLTCDLLETGAAASLPTPSSGPASGLGFQMLARCVLGRWDGHAHRFVDTRNTVGLVLEREAMFPNGDAQASAEFAALLLEKSESSNLRERAPELLRG